MSEGTPLTDMTTLRLYKVRGTEDGLRGQFRFINGESEWLTKADADHCIACGKTVAVRCNGDCEPYFAVMEFPQEGRNSVGPQNRNYNRLWEPPRVHTLIKSDEFKEKYKAIAPKAEAAVKTNKRGKNA